MSNLLQLNDIKHLLRQSEHEIAEELLVQIKDDKRQSVQKLYQQYLTRQEKEQLERERVKQLYMFETGAEFHGKRVAGVDEAGRGPLAGPVYAAAVILPAGFYLRGLNDSKQITAKHRAALAMEIKANAIAWSIASAAVKEIDEFNIQKATHLAMLRALDNLPVQPEHVLVDGNSCPASSYAITTIIDGDAKCACISAASILAKVERDKVMDRYDAEYPCYGFKNNKGYGTREHYEALGRYGPCPLHRATFLKNFLQMA